MRSRASLVIGCIGLWGAMSVCSSCRVVPHEGPVPADPPDGAPRTIVDADGPPPPEQTHVDRGPSNEAAPRDPTHDAGDRPDRPARIAPERVETDINARYAEETAIGGWIARFEREGREVHDRRDEIVTALHLSPGMTVADVGAGTGLFMLRLAEEVGERGTAYAVDVQAHFLDHIVQKARKAGLDNVKVVKATQDDVGLPKGSIDLALMCDAYHHVERPAPYLESLYQALRPGGRLVIIDYRRVEGVSEPWLLDHIRASPEQFRAEIEGAGFSFLRAHEGMLQDNFFFEFERP